MIQIVKIIALAGILLYVIFILFLLLGWIKKRKFTPARQHSDKFVSIVVAIRNEEKNLPFLLRCLENQSYPWQYFEILLIDDHSIDGSHDLMQQFAAAHNNVCCLSLPPGIEGKKSAIRFGIEHAKGELILTTDADCRLKQEWLSTIVTFQHATQASMIIAPVAYLCNNSFFEKIQALEFASLIASGASSANLGRPILCNGANLAFLKSVYPFDDKFNEMNSPSGDDIFLLLHLKKTKRKSIHFLKSLQSIVYTNPSPTLSAFINQRKRWYGKSIHYTDPEILGCGLLVSYANFSLLFSFALAIALPSNWNFFLWILLLKLTADVAFLYPFLYFIKSRQLIWLAPLLEILYPFYILYIIIASRIGQYKWKGREYGM
jgi:glycosyltransferase involved in cell wall biosynthesis